AIPVILEGKHTLLVAPTGLGKTEAAALPLFHNLMSEEHWGIAVLYITPLRALNRDMLKRMKEMGERLDISVAVRHGDTSPSERTRQSKNPPQVLITTPETLQVLFTGSRLRKHLENVRYVVIDEVHELAASDRGAQLSVGLERLERLSGPFQRIGLSATVGDLDEIARFLGGRGRKVEVVKVPVARELEITVEAPETDPREKEVMGKVRAEKGVARAILRAEKIIDDHTSTLFFVNTRDTAEALGSRFAMLGVEGILVHHGSLSKEIRIDAEDMFKKGEVRALICTSSLELGIDIGSADHVIQYNSPRSPSRLIQRTGRSGHSVHGKPRGTILADHPDEIAEACVIARRAVEEELERWKVRPNPLEVLGNQAVSFFLCEGRGATMDEFYKVATRAYPFLSLPRARFDMIMDFLLANHLLFQDEEDGRAGTGRRGRTYFYENISMIPDERSFAIRDIVSQRIIGRLDERFVASYVQPTAAIVVGGKTWEVISSEEKEILVEPARDMGEIPHWSGEDLPVPYEVARDVGRLRETSELNKNGKRWMVNELAQRSFSDFISEQKEEGSLLAGSNMVIEGRAGEVVINACLGTKVNETIGKLVSGLLAARTGQSVSLRAEAYRIMLKGPSRMDAAMVAEALSSINPDGMEDLVRIILRNTSYMRWQFVYAARKFGIMKKEVDYSKIDLGRMMEEYLDSPVYRAAIEKVLWEKMDIPRSKGVLRRLASGEMQLHTWPKISRIGAAGYERMNEVVVSRRPTHAILSALKERLDREKVLLLCLGCHKGITRPVGDVEERVRCIYCGGKMMAALHPRERQGALSALEKKDPGPKEKKMITMLQKRATIVMAHGKRAVQVLRARGIGPGKAPALLGLYRDEEEFLAAILKAEVEYARNRRFWD
ncbi:MAG: DEAD/DEAH box helicase, partial [Thermoplasmata archaeon]|nr:DEAD/DEAH box helicase [Thermoplasmata archaeon]